MLHRAWFRLYYDTRVPVRGNRFICTTIDFVFTLRYSEIGLESGGTGKDACTGMQCPSYRALRRPSVAHFLVIENDRLPKVFGNLLDGSGPTRDFGVVPIESGLCVGAHHFYDFPHMLRKVITPGQTASDVEQG